MVQKLLHYIVLHKFELSLLLIIIIIAAFFRLYKISDYMTFLGDEGRDAIIAREITQGDFTLLGPRASAGDFFLGPIYYYMMAPFLVLSSYDPVGPAVMVALIGIATVYLIYHVSRRFFGISAGLTAASLYAISPLAVAYSRSSWNPNPMPFFALLMLYLLYLSVKSQKPKLFLAVGFLLGIAMQLHYLTTFLGVIIFLFVLIGQTLVVKKALILSYVKNYALIFGGFIIGISPFLLFEIRHGFPNTQTVIKFVFEDNASETYLNTTFLGNITGVFFRLFSRLLFKYPPQDQLAAQSVVQLQLIQGLVIVTAVLSIGALFFVKERLKSLLLVIWLVVGVCLFGFYKGSIYDYYLGFMFPLPFILLGGFIYMITRKWNHQIVGRIIAVVLIIFIMFLNLSGAPFLYPGNKQKDQAKGIANFVLEKTDGKPYNFALLTRGNSDHVYRYFFEVANRQPVVLENLEKDPERKSVTGQLMIVCEYHDCQPLGDSLWEVAGFGRAEIAGEWALQHVKVFRLVPFSEN